MILAIITLLVVIVYLLITISNNQVQQMKNQVKINNNLLAEMRKK